MNLLDGILAHNKQFVENKEYEKFQTSKFPNKRLVVVSCMDTRLVELLPKAMDVANGDVKIVKTAGAIVSHPFGSIMRSILVAVYELGADEVCVVGHYDCGMASLEAQNTLKKMKDRGVSQESLDMLNYAGVDFEKFLRGFDCVEDSVKHSVELIRKHPLLPRDIPVHGLVIDPKSGRLDVMVNGYQAELSSTV
ncbi:beta-class carbonic anhydrase [Shimazuella alba]|uniref:carbonic anhydrase n=1 Tax=Shimazuella alba TaxID=2690964 RepID=A0A6I4VTB1_9BACL|nr:carbonic anhydrase [Shimazuella alba]MXQ53728.1 carbonic anhydrase [Shimazuella alba]